MDTFFKKRKQHGCHVYLVAFLVHWYQKQTICVKWGNYLSDTFSVSNGINQGGMLSLMLFNIYVEDLSTVLDKCNVDVVLMQLFLIIYIMQMACGCDLHVCMG